MPLPWKKAKVTRISRIVADLQPPKRGGSLVVETGFPTSLIDLFVKNRDRLKRPSSKMSKRNKKNDDTRGVDSVDDLRLDVFNPSPAESNSSELGVEEFKADENPRNSNSSENPSPGAVELLEMRQTTVMETAGERGEEEEEEEEAAPDVYMAVVKVFAVAVLALSTKKLAVGITLSAFALLFIEFVAKRLVVRFAGGFRRIRERQSMESESESESEEEEFVAPPRERPSPVGDITALETLRGIKDDEVFLRPELEQLSRDKKWGFLDAREVLTDQAPALDKSKSKSKRGKIRRKIIKNFVPKTLRSVSKKKKNSNSSNSNRDRLEAKMEEQEKSQEFEDAEEMAEDFSGLSVLSEEAEEGEEEEEEVVEEKMEEEEEKEMKWLLVIIIFGAILLGLCWGRIFAVLLTIVWCVVMKLIGIIGTDERKSSLTLAQPC